MQNFEENLASRVNGSLQPLLGVTVTVKTEQGLLATIYSDDGATVQPNPMVTDANGRFGFYAANGQYELTFAGAQIETITRDIELYDADDEPPLTQAQAALPSAASRVGFQADGDGAQGRTIENKLRETVSANDYVTYQAAYDAVADGGTILVPDATLPPGVVTGAKRVTWEVMGDTSANLALLSLPGLVISRHASSRMIRQGSSSAADYATARVDRSSNHSGGTPGNVSSAMKVYTSVAPDVANFEWTLVAQLDNNATVGENCAFYAQANKLSTGPTFAAVSEARDKTNLPNPSAGMVAHEIDIFANGTDSNTNRIGADYVVGKGIADGDACEAYTAMRVVSQNGVASNGEWVHALVIGSAKNAAIRMRQTGQMGIDFSEATFTDPTVPSTALRLKSGQKINFQSTDNRTLQYEPTTSRLRYATGSAVLFEVADNGALYSTGSVYVAGTKVVGARVTGFVQMTGTPDKTTAINTETATLLALSRRVKALEDVLITHGIIGV